VWELVRGGRAFTWRADLREEIADLHSFLEAYQDEHIHIKKAVQLDNIGALVGHATDTIVFDNIEGYPGFRLVDQLFSNRKAQARVLWCEPKDVVKRLAPVVREGPKPLKVVDGGRCQE